MNNSNNNSTESITSGRANVAASMIEQQAGAFLRGRSPGQYIDLVHEAQDGDQRIVTPLVGRLVAQHGNMASTVVAREKAQLEQYPDVDWARVGSVILWHNDGKSTAANIGGFDGLPKFGRVRVRDDREVPDVADTAAEVLAKEPEDRPEPEAAAGPASSEPLAGLFTTIRVPTAVAEAIEAADVWRVAAQNLVELTNSDHLQEAYYDIALATARFIGIGVQMKAVPTTVTIVRRSDAPGLES